MSEILVFAFLFFIGSCLGWCMEVVFRRFFSKSNPERKWINPGFLTGPYLPIYGFGLWGMYFVSMLSSVNMTGNEAADAVIILVTMAVVMTYIYKGNEFKAVGLHGDERKYSGDHMPAVFNNMGTFRMYILFCDKSICHRVDSMAFSPSCIFIFYRHVFWNIRNRCMVFDAGIGRNKEVCEGKRDRNKVRGIERVSCCAEKRAGREKTLFAGVQDRKSFEAAT